MLYYNGRLLTCFKVKNAGKNKNTVDGFYRDTDNNEYFIKRPADKSELFAELFAGLLLNEFKKIGLIDSTYTSSIICADLIQLPDGSYGLIQPLIAFDELHKIIGTTNRAGTDRDPKLEALFGPSYYEIIMQQGPHFGLSIALMYSLLLSAHSVHSGNIVALKKTHEGDKTQYGRIDWGDSFRNFAHPDNNRDILYAYENRGILNFKQLTKDYFLNYRKLQGLFPAVAVKAEELQEKLSLDLLTQLICNALQKIPTDLLDKETQGKLARYMVMESFKKVTFAGENTVIGQFPHEMASLMLQRLEKITALQDIEPSSAEKLYSRSVIYNSADGQMVSSDDATPCSLSSEYKKDVKSYTARIKKLAPLLAEVKKIEIKAQTFNKRGETAAYAVAMDLVYNLRSDIDNYAAGCQSDADDLSYLGKMAYHHLKLAKPELSKHRKEWKVILANVTLAFSLLGIGYIPAILINKRCTGHYAFFTRTDSMKKVNQLENTLFNTIQSISAA